MHLPVWPEGWPVLGQTMGPAVGPDSAAERQRQAANRTALAAQALRDEVHSETWNVTGAIGHAFGQVLYTVLLHTTNIGVVLVGGTTQVIGHGVVGAAEISMPAIIRVRDGINKETQKFLTNMKAKKLILKPVSNTKGRAGKKSNTKGRAGKKSNKKSGSAKVYANKIWRKIYAKTSDCPTYIS